MKQYKFFNKFYKREYTIRVSTDFPDICQYRILWRHEHEKDWRDSPFLAEDENHFADAMTAEAMMTAYVNKQLAFRAIEITNFTHDWRTFNERMGE